MHFALRSCDISSLAGRNIFRSRNVAIRRLVDYFLSTNSVTPSNKNKNVINLVREGQCYRDAVQCNTLTPEICLAAEQECRGIISSCTTSTEEIVSLYRRYQHLYLKDRGVAIEQIVIHHLREQGRHILDLTKENRSFNKTFTTTLGDHTYTIYGCVDCIEQTPDSQSLIEIKSRKLQQVQYTHEKDQITVYLVISDYPSACLAEYISGEVVLSNEMNREQALDIWDNEIREPLEKSLYEVVQRITNSLP